jgi:hypothetical protein
MHAVAAGIKTAEEALALVGSFYPASRIPPKVLFGVEQIMEQVAASGRAAGPPPAVR